MSMKMTMMTMRIKTLKIALASIGILLVAACGEKQEAKKDWPQCVKEYKCQDVYISDSHGSRYPAGDFRNRRKPPERYHEESEQKPSSGFGMSYSGKLGPTVGPFILTDKGLELGFGF